MKYLWARPLLSDLRVRCLGAGGECFPPDIFSQVVGLYLGKFSPFGGLHGGKKLENGQVGTRYGKYDCMAPSSLQRPARACGVLFSQFHPS